MKVLLSKRLIKDNYFYKVIENLFDKKNNISIVLDVLKRLLDSNENNEECKGFLLNKLKENYKLLFSKEVICDKNLLELIKIIDDNEVYEEWLLSIKTYFNGTSYFAEQNKILDYSFKEIPESFWINKVSENIKISFVKSILDQSHPKYLNCSNSARVLSKNFEDEYPLLIDEFLGYLINSNNDHYFREYDWFLKEHIKNNEKKDYIEEKLQTVNEERKDNFSSIEDLNLDVE